jgi:hypothetical protein
VSSARVGGAPIPPIFCIERLRNARLDFIRGRRQTRAGIEPDSSMTDILLLLVLGVAGWLWLDGNRAREIARAAGRATCQRAQVQFLDDSVARDWQGLRRDARGRLVFARQYGFEFTRSGAYRYHGRVHLLGYQVEGVELEPFRVEENA